MTLAPFIDNRGGLTLDTALVAHLAAARGVAQLQIDIASGFFDLGGFLLLSPHLRDGDTVRLLLGAEPPREASLPVPKPGDPTGPERHRVQLAAALQEQDAGLALARDLLPFDAATDRAIAQLLGLLAAKRLEVRRVEKQFLPARGVMVRNASSAFVGTVNLSQHGLTGQPSVVLGLQATPGVDRLGAGFDTLWAEAVPFDLAKLYQPLTANFDPYLIYMRVLYALYGDELAEEGGAKGDIPITGFQQHGVWRALGIIKRYGGVLIADGVGLGKTFTAGEIIRRYRERRQRVLLVCPAALRDGTWADFLDKYQLYVTCVSYEQLAADRRFNDSDGPDYLKNDLDDYALVVVDESHNYRNPNSPARAGVLRHLLRGPRRDVVLLSATPVNNSLWDLFHLLRFFLKRDAALAERGVLSVREQFLTAMKQDPFNLSPDVLYPILDATTVKRTRHFVKKHYENEQIRMPDGTVQPIRFPKPVPSSITYNLDAVLPGFLPRLEAALMPPPPAKPRLTMARYQVDNYATTGDGKEGAVVGLLRSALLKRFESSVCAFAMTTAKMVREHEFFLEGLDSGVVYHKAVVREVSAADEEDADELLDELAERMGPGDSLGDYDANQLRQDVENDLTVLRDFRDTARAISASNDPKLAALVEELVKIANEAKKDGVDASDEQRNRKVLVFSFYADTVDWIYDHLTSVLNTDKRLAAYKGRIAAVAGTESKNGVSREAAVTGFAPESAGKVGGKDRFDLLVTTDVLAEGLNLQQCRNIINFDLPWNPMRLVQRHGRVDRIGSPHLKVFLRTFFPDKELDRLLALEARVRRKLAQAAASVGVEAAPIENSTETEVTFSDSKEEIERLRAGDASLYETGGTGGASLSGEEYRQELRKALKRMGDKIRNLPWRAGSGLVRGKERGHVFCAAVGERVFVRFVPFGAKELKADGRELGSCLRRIECAEGSPRAMPDDLLAGVYAAWDLARQDIYDDWSEKTDPLNLLPRVPTFLREVAEFLRKYPPSRVSGPDLDRYVQSIEAPLPRREETELRRVFDAAYAGNKAKADAVARKVEELGLEPFVPPDPLPPITDDEIHLVCWMAVEREE